MNDIKSKPRKKLLIVLPIILAIVIIAGAITWYFQIKKPHDEAVAAFNVAISALDEQNSILDKAIDGVQAVIDSGNKPYDNSVLVSAKGSVKAAKAARHANPEMPNKTDDIIAITKTLKPVVDYTVEVKKLAKSEGKLSESIKQYKQITNPSKAFVIKRLKLVSSISDIKAATERNDPNELLGKQGGYVAAIFFSSDHVKDVDGGDSIKKGTVGGGCIEVYANAKYAKQRDAYLSAFDGSGMLNPGSHHVIGTIVVRTSSELTASQQKDLEKQITEKLIAIKN